MGGQGVTKRLIKRIVDQMHMDLVKIEKSSKNDADYYTKLIIYLQSNLLDSKEYTDLISEFNESIVKVFKKSSGGISV